MYSTDKTNEQKNLQKRGTVILLRNANQPTFEVCLICITNIIMKIQQYASVYCIVLLCWTSKKNRQQFLNVNKNGIKIMIKDNFNSLLILP